MYLGLYTFKTKEECEASLLKPSITVLSPNGGETWVVGNSYEIKWENKGVNSVNILLCLEAGDIPCTVLASNISAQLEKFTWKVINVPVGDVYKVYIRAAENPKIQDYSDNYFSIVGAATPSITVLSPNGGETWVKGKKHLIKLSNRPVKCPTVGADCGVYSIQLIDENKNYIGTIRCGYFTPFEAASQIKTEFEWDTRTVLDCCGAGCQPQEVKPGKYKIRIADRYSPEIIDESDNYFSISQ